MDLSENGIFSLFQIDWRIFMAGAEAWLQGRNPYGALSAEFGAGAFAYPPPALTWLALFTLLGPLGFYVWTALQLGGWWWLIKDERPEQIVLLLIWSPVVLHLVQGQSSLPVVLVIWAAFKARRRGLLWGLALAWALTKPQVALVPLAWLLWQDRAAPGRLKLWGGMLLGGLVLALPPTLRDPGIWGDWLVGLGAYRARILQMTAWQGPSALLLGLAAFLWYRSGYGQWHWWAAATLFPQTSFYGLVALIPAMRPRMNPWLIGGLLLAALLQGPMSELLMPWILAGHALAAWMVAGGPQRAPATREVANAVVGHESR